MKKGNDLPDRIQPSGRHEPAYVPSICNKNWSASVAWIGRENDGVAEEILSDGYLLELLDPAALEIADLDDFDAIGVGLGAYELREDGERARARVLAYKMAGRIVIDCADILARMRN
jgi:hypothetical protein